MHMQLDDFFRLHATSSDAEVRLRQLLRVH
jgi:hypothetical protein